MVRELMDMEKDITDEVQKWQLIWFGHTNRMDETKWPRKVLDRQYKGSNENKGPR
jgi:hypothetical protein